ncbi:MAG: HD domain-containing protein [Candidatus Nezhaarchaeota archaeon]|nr:HD domain-containing protein [Candidatus Nezhaarchaeota archaeon]
MLIRQRAGEVKDPVHGYIYFSDSERKIIDSRPLQRLRRIKQLAGSELTYPGACHSRFLHSLGVMYLTGLMAERLVSAGCLSEDESIKLRLAGLLHDVGHGPFSHVYEEVLYEKKGITHEDVTVKVVKESEVGDILEGEGFRRDEIAELSAGRLKGRPLLNQVITGRLSPDTMDYILRDSYFAGVGFGLIDVRRLIDSVTVVDDLITIEYPGGLYVLEAFIIARLELFNAVYFHRTVRAANVMLSRAMNYADDYLGLTRIDEVDRFLSMDDLTTTASLLSLKEGDKADVAKKLVSMFIDRKLFKSTYEAIVHGEEGHLTAQLQRADVKRKLEEEIGAEAKVDPDYVAIDVSSVVSIPIHPRDGARILVSRKKRDGAREVLKVTEVSSLLSSLTRSTEMLRVYTLSEYREAVAKACRRVFDEGFGENKW